MRTVCGYSLSFSSGSAGAVWAAATTWIADWYEGVSDGAGLPDGWTRGFDGRLTLHGDHSLECSVARITGERSRLHEYRWRFRDAADPSLRWTIEVAVLDAEDVLFTLVLKIASADFEVLPARYQLRPPRLIGTLLDRGDGRIGAHAVQSGPIVVDADGVAELAMLLLEQSRRHPIVVLSPSAGSDLPAVDPETIASALVGLASVYVLDSMWAGFALTDELGKRLSCYNGAVRIYWPRLHRDSDAFAHPLWLTDEIAESANDEAFARMLLRLVAGAASFRFIEPEAIRTFRRAADEARASRREPSLDYDALFAEYVRTDALARELRGQLDAALEEIAVLRLDRGIAATRDSGRWEARPPGERTDPTNVVEAVEAARRTTSHIVYLEDAFESARASPFRNADKVVSALLAIDDVAKQWAAQLDGGGKSLGPRRDAFRQRGFTYKEDISPTAEGKWGDDYAYVYGGRRVIFAAHITIGAKSADRCLSIHMHWDENMRRVVVAHVGRHKTNTLS